MGATNAPFYFGAGYREALGVALYGTLRVVFDSLTPYPGVPGPLLPQHRYPAWLSFKQ